MRTRYLGDASGSTVNSMAVLRWLSVGSILLVAASAYAFNSDEHERLANRAFAIALDMSGVSCKESAPKEKPFDSVCELSPERPNASISYGQIDARVDFMLSPEELFVQIGKSNSYPSNSAELNPSIVGPYSISSKDLLRSSHNNEAHFQGYALFNLHDWHNRARWLAADQHNLFAALVANAVSDHFLNDFFAPGHIVTPRYNFSDPFALAMHDYYNKIGAHFYVNDWTALEVILDYIDAQESKPGGSQYGIKLETIRALREHHDAIYLQGDGRLKDEPDEELFITLIEVASVREVLDCFQSASGCSTNHFSEYLWTPATLDVNAHLPIKAPEAGMHFGKYGSVYGQHEEVATPQLYYPVLGLSGGEETIFVDKGQYRFSVALETIPFGWPGSPDYLRHPYDATKPDSNKPVFGINLGPALGFYYSQASDYHVLGPSFRFVADFPLNDMQISPIIVTWTMSSVAIMAGDRHMASGGILDSAL